MIKKRHFCIQSIGFGYLILFLLVAQNCLAAEGPTLASVRRPDPRSSDLVPVDPGEVKPGKIYNHFSQRHGRYVWAYANDSGGFSYALGTGSSELPDNFDLVTSSSETQELVEEKAGTWAKQSRSEGKQILVRLGADEKWQIVRGRTIRAHFDIDSGRRWEWHGRRRVAVLHTHGDLWGYNGSRYVPVNPWHLSAYQYDSGQSCAHCASFAHP